MARGSRGDDAAGRGHSPTFATRHRRQLRLPRRPADRRGQGEDDRLARGERQRQRPDPLQAARLAVLPPALLGRAVPDRLGKDGDHHAVPESELPAARAGDGGLQADRRPARPARQGRPTGSTTATSCTPRNQHHAPVGRLVLVLPALLRSAQHRALHRPRKPSDYWMGCQIRTATLREPAGRPLRRRHRARRAAPALRPLLAQGALRPRPRLAPPSRSSGWSTRA